METFETRETVDRHTNECLIMARNALVLAIELQQSRVPSLPIYISKLHERVTHIDALLQ